MLHIVQLHHPNVGRRLAIVSEPLLQLTRYASVVDAAWAAIECNRGIEEAVQASLSPSEGSPVYDNVYDLRSPWRLLPPLDHPIQPCRCLVSGTGLTHKGSADSRQSMHVAGHAPANEPMTDSMKMYILGIEGGRPAPGQIGAAPEWFYKGNATILRAHGEALDVPNFADDGGDEAEIARAYIIGPGRTPYRIGLVQGNEFSDHATESKNYAYLAPSKLRTCGLGPELIVGAEFDHVPGRIRIERGGAVIWESSIVSGERAMSHSLANLEHHHFKYEQHRRPGDVHLHFFGADHFSFRDRIRLADGDVMVISFDGFGRSLRNPVRIDHSRPTAVAVTVL